MSNALREQLNILRINSIIYYTTLRLDYFLTLNVVLIYVLFNHSIGPVNEFLRKLKFYICSILGKESHSIWDSDGDRV